MTVHTTVVGYGAIGSRVAAELAAGRVSGAALAGVVTRRPGAARPHPELSLESAIAAGHLIVECAGAQVAGRTAPLVVAGGGTVLLVSLGLLAQPEMRSQLFRGPGRCVLSTGAIGGLDILRAAARGGGLSAARIVTTKRAETLVQPWMDDDERGTLAQLDSPRSLFSGTVAEAVERFPASLNITCAVAEATGLWEETRVELVADPVAARTRHEITASGSSGEYRFNIANAPSATTPTTSAVTAEAVLRGIEREARPSGVFV